MKAGTQAFRRWKRRNVSRPRFGPQPIGAIFQRVEAYFLSFMATAIAPTFETETFAASVAQRLEALNAGQEFFADYVSLGGRSLSQPELSKIIRGLRTIDSKRKAQINVALDELEKLSELFASVPLRFDDAVQIHDLVCCCVRKPEVAEKINDSLEKFRGFLSAASSAPTHGAA